MPKKLAPQNPADSGSIVLFLVAFRAAALLEKSKLTTKGGTVKLVWPCPAAKNRLLSHWSVIAAGFFNSPAFHSFAPPGGSWTSRESALFAGWLVRVGKTPFLTSVPFCNV